MKKKLLSLQSSGESVEKALSIHFTSLQTNAEFYSKYKTVIFYGHNLPKKNKMLNVHGTIGFYSEFLSDIAFIPECSRKYLIDKRDSILEMLCIKGYVSERNGCSLSKNPDTYWEFIRKIPFEYLYPEFYQVLILNSCKLLNIESLLPLYLEDNWPKVLSKINIGYSRYSIYGLEGNGKVGKYYIHGNIEDDYKLVNDLKNKASLSGNSAILLQSVGHRIGGQTIVGYRVHRRYVRPNRDYALNYLLESHESIYEPSNAILSREFDKIPNEYGDEMKTNIVYARTYRSYLEDNRFGLNL